MSLTTMWGNLCFPCRSLQASPEPGAGGDQRGPVYIRIGEIATAARPSPFKQNSVDTRSEGAFCPAIFVSARKPRTEGATGEGISRDV